jgi:hypothetical protein
MILAHLIAKRDVFVTSDRDFDPLANAPSLGHLTICAPEAAVDLIPR